MQQNFLKNIKTDFKKNKNALKSKKLIFPLFHLRLSYFFKSAPDLG